MDDLWQSPAIAAAPINRLSNPPWALRSQERASLRPPGDTAERLAAELRRMAGWLGLDEVRVEPKGDLSERLGDALSSL